MDEPLQTSGAAKVELSTLAITLLKGVIYREDDERQWADSTFKPPALAVLAAEGCLNSPFRGFR